MGARLFFHDLGVLNHGNATALSHLSFQRDGLAAVFGELIVHRLVFADDEIRFALADDAGRPSAPDALGPARLTVLLADGVMIDIAHHIDHFAGHFFRTSCVASVLVLLRDRHWRKCQSSDESRSDGNFQDGWFARY